MIYKYTITDQSGAIVDSGAATTHHNAQCREYDIFIEDVMFAAYDNGHHIKIETVECEDEN